MGRVCDIPSSTDSISEEDFYILFVEVAFPAGVPINTPDTIVGCAHLHSIHGRPESQKRPWTTRLQKEHNVSALLPPGLYFFLRYRDCFNCRRKCHCLPTLTTLMLHGLRDRYLSNLVGEAYMTKEPNEVMVNFI
jgi:hypothetical protein